MTFSDVASTIADAKLRFYNPTVDFNILRHFYDLSRPFTTKFMSFIIPNTVTHRILIFVGRTIQEEVWWSSTQSIGHVAEETPRTGRSFANLGIKTYVLVSPSLPVLVQYDPFFIQSI